MMGDVQHGLDDLRFAYSRRGSDMGKVRGKVAVETDRNLPADRRGIIGVRRRVDQRLKPGDKLVPRQNQRVVIH